MAETTDNAKIKEAIKRRKKEVYKPVVPDMQLGFVHNNVDCIGCRACEGPPLPLELANTVQETAVAGEHFDTSIQLCRLSGALPGADCAI